VRKPSVYRSSNGSPGSSSSCCSLHNLCVSPPQSPQAEPAPSPVCVAEDAAAAADVAEGERMPVPTLCVSPPQVQQGDRTSVPAVVRAGVAAATRI
jgi:hypothetical protein